MKQKLAVQDIHSLLPTNRQVLPLLERQGLSTRYGYLGGEMSTTLLPLPGLELVMLSVILWAMEYFCDHLRSTVPTVSPPNPLSTSNRCAEEQRESAEAV